MSAFLRMSAAIAACAVTAVVSCSGFAVAAKPRPRLTDTTPPSAVITTPASGATVSATTSR